MVYVKFKSPEAQISLIQLRSQIINLGAVLPGHVGHIVADAAAQQRLSLLPAHHQNHLGELPVAVRIHDPEDQRKRRLLP